MAKSSPVVEDRPIIVFGPEMPGWGSWEWIGGDLQKGVSKYFRTIQFSHQEIPACDVLVIVKHALPFELVEQVSCNAAVIYCPLDFYGSSAEIDAEARMLRKCSRILVHCERLRRYFAPYASVEFMDHHIKFATTRLTIYRREGFLLWVGVRTNLPPLVAWINDHTLPLELRILTNLENPGAVPRPEDLGFRKGSNIRVQNWDRKAQSELTRRAKAALDIKGDEFRSKHKPPAKAIDFIASGLPLAMNPDSSPVEHLARLGFEIADPLNPDRWFSKEYWQETQNFGLALREILSLERIGWRWKRIIDEVLVEKRM